MSHNFITPPPLYAIVSFKEIKNFHELIIKLLEAKVGWIQLRNKNDLPDLEYIGFIKKTLKLRDSVSKESKIIVNDNVNIAKISEADGVHLGQQDMNPKEARLLLGEGSIIGLSTNNIEQVKSAPLKDVSYLACGPVFLSKTKSGHAEPLGLKGVSLMTALTNCPFVAIGGITLENSAEVFKAGAKSIALVSELVRHETDLLTFKENIDTKATCNL